MPSDEVRFAELEAELGRLQGRLRGLEIRGDYLARELFVLDGQFPKVGSAGTMGSTLAFATFTWDKGYSSSALSCSG